MYYLNLIIKQKKSQKLLVFLLNFLWVLVILLVCQHSRNFSQEINETLPPGNFLVKVVHLQSNHNLLFHFQKFLFPVLLRY